MSDFEIETWIAILKTQNISCTGTTQFWVNNIIIEILEKVLMGERK